MGGGVCVSESLSVSNEHCWFVHICVCMCRFDEIEFSQIRENFEIRSRKSALDHGLFNIL